MASQIATLPIDPLPIYPVLEGTQPIRFAIAPWAPRPAETVLDEVALYSRVLTQAEVSTPAQRTAPPLALGDTFVVTEETTTVLNVVANDLWVGQKANLVVEIMNQGSLAPSPYPATTTSIRG